MLTGCWWVPRLRSSPLLQRFFTPEGFPHFCLLNLFFHKLPVLGRHSLHIPCIIRCSLRGVSVRKWPLCLWCTVILGFVAHQWISHSSRTTEPILRFQRRVLVLLTLIQTQSFLNHLTNQHWKIIRAEITVIFRILVVIMLTYRWVQNIHQPSSLPCSMTFYINSTYLPSVPLNALNMHYIQCPF